MSETLNRDLSDWTLADPRPLAQTATSRLFLVRMADDESAVLKLLTPLDAAALAEPHVHRP